MDATYQVTVTVEPSHQTVPLLGEVIFGDQTSLFARCSGLSAGAAETPRARKSRAAVNFIIIIVVVVVVVVDGLEICSEEKCRKGEARVGRASKGGVWEDEVRYRNEERVGGCQLPFKYEKEGTGGKCEGAAN